MIVLGLTVLMQFSCQNLESFFAKEIPEISISAPPHALETKMAANVHRTLSYMKSSRLMSAFKVHTMHRASRIGNKPDQKNKCHNLLKYAIHSLSTTTDHSRAHICAPFIYPSSFNLEGHGSFSCRWDWIWLNDVEWGCRSGILSLHKSAADTFFMIWSFIALRLVSLMLTPHSNGLKGRWQTWETSSSYELPTSSSHPHTPLGGLAPPHLISA